MLPSLAMPIIEINGALDNNAPVKGGIGRNAVDKIPHRPVANTIDIWSHAGGYDPTSPVLTKTETYSLSEYDGSRAPFDYYLLTQGGHTWPGGIDLTAGLGTGKLIASFNADAIQWQFFSQFTRPQLAASGGSLVPEPVSVRLIAVGGIAVICMCGRRRPIAPDRV